MKKLLWGVAALLVLGLGWVWLQRGTGEHATGADADALLAYIPADTPYVMATLEPMPAEASAHAWEQSRAFIEAYRELFRDMRGKLDTAGDPDAARLTGFIDSLEQEFAGKTPAEAIAHLGFAPGGLGALYGVGLAPVVRVQLGDPEKLRGFIQRMQAAAGVELEVGQIDQHSYWTSPSVDVPVQMLMAIIDRQLILGIAPKAAEPGVLRLLLGLDRPASSMADGDALQQHAKSAGLLPYFSGYLDSSRLLDAWQKSGDPVHAAFRDALKIAAPEAPDPACLADWRRMTEAWPGISMGYTRYDVDGNTLVAILRSHPDIANQLTKLRAPMPGAGLADDTAMMDFGLSLSLNQLPAVVTALSGLITSQPFACAQLADWNKLAGEARTGINNPALFAAAPVFSGLHLFVDELTIAPGMQEPSGSGVLVLGSDNPDALLGMLRSVAPPFANFDFGQPGEVVALPALPGVPANLPLYASRGDKLIGLAFGEASKASLPSRMRASAEHQPLLQVGVSNRLYEAIADAMEQIAPTLPEGESREQLLLQARLMRMSYAKMFKDSQFSLELSARGIEWRQVTTHDR